MRGQDDGTEAKEIWAGPGADCGGVGRRDGEAGECCEGEGLGEGADVPDFWGEGVRWVVSEWLRG